MSFEDDSIESKAIFAWSDVLKHLRNADVEDVKDVKGTKYIKGMRG